MHSHQPLSLLTKLKKQNNKIGAFHSNTKLFGKKKELTSLHACIPRASYHICSQCFIKKRLQPLFLLVWGWSSAPQPWQKSKGAAGYWGWGPAEPGHLPGSSQACLKGMVKWYWYLPIRNSLSYLSLLISGPFFPASFMRTCYWPTSLFFVCSCWLPKIQKKAIYLESIMHASPS